MYAYCHLYRKCIEKVKAATKAPKRVVNEKVHAADDLKSIQMRVMQKKQKEKTKTKL